MASQDSQSQPFHWHYTELNDHDFQIHGSTFLFVIVLFSGVLLLFSLLLFFYARWVCRHHFPNSDPSSPERSPQGLDPASIGSLPITLYKSSSVSPTPGDDNRNSNNSECCICLGGYEDGEKVKVLPRCHHCFHSQCVDRWLITQSGCPLCRTSPLDDDDWLNIVVVPIATE